MPPLETQPLPQRQEHGRPNDLLISRSPAIDPSAISPVLADIATPGVVAEIDAEAAVRMGAFEEFAHRHADAWDANMDISPLDPGGAAAEPGRDRQDADSRAYARQVSDLIAQQLEQGVAAWLQSSAAAAQQLPRNGRSAQPYSGINALWLAAVSTERGFEDPRWLTSTEAQLAGGQVRQGELGARIDYWTWRENLAPQADLGQPMTAADGTQPFVTVEYERPQLFQACVFNAEQIDGMPPLDRLGEDFESAPAIPPALTMGRIRYGNAALQADSMRDARFPAGSKAAARRDLTDTLARFFLGDPASVEAPDLNASTIEKWARALRADPEEIFRVAAEAQTAATLIMQSQLKLDQTEEFSPTPIAGDLAMADGDEKTASVDFQVPELVGQTAPQQTSTERVYLAVPFGQKDDAKALGAQWDSITKAWYAPPGAALGDYARLMPTDVVRMAPDAIQNVQDSFGEALRAAGLQLAGAPIMDGKLHRVRVEGNSGSGRDGAYVGHLDGQPSGFIQNHKTGLKTNWTASHSPLTSVDRAAIAAGIVARRLARDREMENQHKLAAENAARIWDAAAPCESHPYLTRKAIQPHGIRVATAETIQIADTLYRSETGERDHNFRAGDLIVPAYGSNGDLATFQAIRANGRKGFAKGGRLVGASYVIGDTQSPGSILVAEGFATAATLHELTGQPVAVAFSSGNLRPVAEVLRLRFPERAIGIAGDNDHHAPRTLDYAGKPKPNIGVKKAIEACKAIAGFPVLPRFPASSDGSDWNDHAKEQGKDATASRLNTVITRGEWRKLGAAQARGAHDEAVKKELATEKASSQTLRAKLAISR